MRINQSTRDYFEVGDREDLSYEEKLAAYRRLADDYFQVERVRGFCAEQLAAPRRDAARLGRRARVRPAARRHGPVDVPAARAEHFVAHYRGLLAAWARDQQG